MIQQPVVAPAPSPFAANTVLQEGGAPDAEWEGSGRIAKKDRSERSLVLLVEDDFMLRGSIAELLIGEGYTVTCAANGLEALRRLERGPKPALILLDVMMPYMDGLEFRAIQRTMPDIADIPVIVLTAVGVPPEAAEELDLRQALFKPLDGRRLLAAVSRRCTPRLP